MRYLYVVYDNKAEMIVGPVHVHHNDRDAMRMFTQLSNHPETDPNKYPDDFELRRVGQIDETTGETFDNNGMKYRILTTARAVLQHPNTGSRGEQTNTIELTLNGDENGR